jgi:tetratricopeptide (TPR) repeat protein
MLGRWEQSEAHYRRANIRMRRRRDAFGIAYSFCGRGNALRMQGRHARALALFKRAERDYRRIGDRVSYAYTLWSMAMARKMLGQLNAARRDLDRADALFQATGDSRGHAYAELGRLELHLLEGGGLARGRALQARALRAAKGYPWESAHAKTLLKPRLAAKVYAKLGSRFRHRGAPVNWP